MKKIFLLLIITIFSIQPVLSATWKEISDKTYIDNDSIELKNSSEYLFWVKNLNDDGELYKSYENLYNKKIWYTLERKIINCKTKEITTKSVYVHDFKAKVVDNYDIKDYKLEWNSIPPDSTNEKLCKYVCNNTSSEVYNMDEINNYIKDLIRRVKMNWDPPIGTENNSVVLLFVIAKNGKLLSCNVIKSSKLRNVDNAAINAVKLTAPFKPLPDEFKGDHVNVEITFDYNTFGTTYY